MAQRSFLKNQLKLNCFNMQTQKLTKYRVNSPLLFNDFKKRLSGIAFFKSVGNEHFIKVSSTYIDKRFIEKGLVTVVLDLEKYLINE